MRNVSEQLLRAELLQSEKSPSTAADFEMVSAHITFPKDVKGKVIIDIGSGVSPVVLRLRREGAIAVGIDIRYRNLGELKNSADQYIKNHLQSADADISESVSRHQEFIRRVSRNRNVFFNRFRAGDRPYVAAQASALPFLNNSVDFAFSDQCLSIGVIHDRQVFLEAVAEGLRVLKSGAELQMCSWLMRAESGKWSTEMFENANVLLEQLLANNIPFHIGHPSESRYLVLSITKK